MRRAAALILGTLAGTGMLVGAKVGNASSGNSPIAAAPGVVVVGAPTTATSGAAGTYGASTGSPTPGTSRRPGTSPAAGASPKPGTTAPRGGATATPTATRTTSKPTPTPPPPKSTTYSASAAVAHNRGTLSMTVTMTGGKITKISASETNPTEPNCYRNACNTLTPEALTAQSAKIDTVSNATYTSQAYIAALTAILGKA
jgi:uncharacterized protein with FMN-binding domain